MKISKPKKFDIWGLMKEMRIELIIPFVATAIGLFELLRTIGTYRVVCQHVLGYDNPHFNCMNPATGNIRESNATSTMAREAENRVQTANAFWEILFEISGAVPAFFADTVLAALGDRYGRKVNILLGITGLLMVTFPYLILFSFHKAPLYILVIMIVLSNFTGFQSVVSISFCAYLADSVVDRADLMVRMTLLTFFSYVSGLATPILSSIMMTSMSYAWCTVITLAVYALTFFLSLVLLKQLPPKIMQKLMLEKYIKKHGHPPEEQGNEMEESEQLRTEDFHEDLAVEANHKDSGDELGPSETPFTDTPPATPTEKWFTETPPFTPVRRQSRQSRQSHQSYQAADMIPEMTVDGRRPTLTAEHGLIASVTELHELSSVKPKNSLLKNIIAVLKEFFVLMKEIYVTWKKPRPARGRTHLLVVTLVYSLHMFFCMGPYTVALPLFMQKSPLFWGPTEIGYFYAFSCGMQLIGSLIGMLLLKKFLKLRDTTIIIFAMATHVVETIQTAFAETSLEMYLASATGAMWSTLFSTLKSFTTQLVEPDEVGKCYLLLSVSNTASVLLSGVMYGSIYMATVAYFPGFLFLLSGGLELICIAAMVWLHFDFKRHNVQL